MTELLKDLGVPREFWEYFEQITKIPRCSGKEEQIREYIKDEAEKLNLNTIIDKVGNLIIRSPRDISQEDRVKIVLQSHMDMVCEKNEDIVHNFSKDPLNLKIVEVEGEKWLTAEGTTLGADNGVGIAYCLTLMKRINKGELNLGSITIDYLFTVDEESGLVGAFQIDTGLIEGDYLINLDSEEDDRLTIGCAGGINTKGEIKVNFEDINDYLEEVIPLKLSISGLIGGHSGVDIHRSRANAIKLMSKILWKLNNSTPIHLHSINGGNRANAIPRECQSIFYVGPEQVHIIKDMLINQIKSEIEMGIKKIEPNMELNIEMLENFTDTRVLPNNLKEKLLHILYAMPNGPISMHPEIPKLVHTSTNLASIKTQEDLIAIVTSQRSLHEISKKIMYEKIEALFKLSDLDIDIQYRGDYPGWDPDFNAKLLLKAKEIYKELFNEDVIVQAIHAGLECGILKNCFPQMEMISIGPTIVGPHSPDERLKIESIEKFWKYLTALLNNFK